jgi:NADH-quinone oxidoreductase subunit M
MFLGEFNAEKWGGLTEINTREILTVAPLAVLTIIIGVYPAPLSNMIRATLENLVNILAR